MPDSCGVRRVALVVLVVLSGVALLATAAASADPLVVRAGEGAVIVRESRAISGEKASVGTVLKAVEGPGATNVLLYLAPPGADLDAVVEYQVAGAADAIRVPVSVRTAPPPTLTDPKIYDKSFRAVFTLFILAVLIENGLAMLFQWRPYRDLFEPRTVNALVAFGFSLAFVKLFDLDVATSLVNTYTGLNEPASTMGSVLTAAIIAGGSAGVNRVFQALGFRATSQDQPPAPKPPRTEAWLAITLVRDKATGPVNVIVTEVGQTPTVAGTISAASRRSIWRYLLRDRGRYPQTGGFPVRLNVEYEVMLQGTDRSGNPIASPRKWGPFAMAAGAIVDIELAL